MNSDVLGRLHEQQLAIVNCSFLFSEFVCRHRERPSKVSIWGTMTGLFYYALRNDHLDKKSSAAAAVWGNRTWPRYPPPTVIVASIGWRKRPYPGIRTRIQHTPAMPLLVLYNAHDRISRNRKMLSILSTLPTPGQFLGSGQN